MGNNSSTSARLEPVQSPRYGNQVALGMKSTKASKSSPSLLRRKRRKNSKSSFLMSHHRTCDDGIAECNLKKRVVFISLMGLFNSWRLCPSFVLHSAVLVLPLKREWIYKLKSAKKSQDLKPLLQDHDFVRFLRWKDEQGLVMWMQDPIDLTMLYDMYMKTPDQFNISTSIHPFWRVVSHKLSNLYDPSTGRNYGSLCLDTQQWQQTHPADAQLVIDELCNLRMRFKSIQTILGQSNASLRVMINYIKDDVDVSNNPAQGEEQGSVGSFCSLDISHPNSGEAARDAVADSDKVTITSPSDDMTWWVSTEY